MDNIGLHMLDPASNGATEEQLQLFHMNWMIQKLYQDRIRLLEQLQQQANGDSIGTNIAPPSPPASNISDEQLSASETVIASDTTADVGAGATTQSQECIDKSHYILLSDEESENEEFTVDEEPASDVPAPTVEKTVERLLPTTVEEDGLHLVEPAPPNVPPAGGPVQAPRRKIRFEPYHFQRRRGTDLAALQMTGPVEVELSYQKNMVRSFVSSRVKACTPEEQLRRIRNTEAARISRAKARVFGVLLEQECSDAVETNASWKQAVAQKRVYIAGLLELLRMPPRDLADEWQQQQDQQAQQLPQQEQLVDDGQHS